ncbi:MAG: hypothetical protein ACJ75N_00805 [Actinomycetes bacterium]
MSDDFSASYSDLLDGTYDCVDRLVLNAYNPLCASPGGFRTWWRRLMGGSDEDLDTAHLMRLAGRFSRRVRAFADAQGIPVIDCKTGERKHELAEAYLREHPGVRGVFLILVARAVAPVWEVERTPNGTIRNLAKKKAFVNHYSFHIMDPAWGHLTIKLSGHPPFGAQIILNGHEYVASRGTKQGLGFTKEGNCFTQVDSTVELAKVADTVSDARASGQLSQLCDRWIYTACLCFGLSLDEQERSGFRYAYSVYQVEYSRNLLFTVGGQMEQVFQDLVDRNRARLGLRQIRTIFGTQHRHLRARTGQRAPRVAATLERPVYSLTVFKLHVGQLTLKGYTKGERVLRFEAIVHNTRELGCGRVIAKLPIIVARLKAILDRALRTLQWMDRAFVADETLDQLPLPSQLGKTRVGGIDLGRPRMRTVLTAIMALALTPRGFTAGELTAKVQEIGGHAFRDYGVRQAAYDLKKLRAKQLVEKPEHSRRYQVPDDGLRTITALVVLREHVLKPLLAAASQPSAGTPLNPKLGRKPKTRSPIDEHYQTLRRTMHALLDDLHLTAA